MQTPLFKSVFPTVKGFPGDASGKELACQFRGCKKTWVQFLGWEDPLENSMATHSSIPSWENPMDRGAWWAMVCRVTKGWKHLNMHAYTHTQDTMAGMNSVLKEDSTEIKTNGLLN